ncbi:MAG: ribosome-binding factor [Chlamydiota bacterium]|jgi:ribosome-binding factor A
MTSKRIPRINSLLKEVISEVILREVRNPLVHSLITVTQVEVSGDLHHAKVHISVIGTDKEKKETIQALQSAAGFIAVHAAKKVVLRYFPALTFKLDTSVEKQIRIDSLLDKIQEERNMRLPENES